LSALEAISRFGGDRRRGVADGFGEALRRVMAWAEGKPVLRVAAG
jgi:hypothetical protein